MSARVLLWVRNHRVTQTGKVLFKNHEQCITSNGNNREQTHFIFLCFSLLILTLVGGKVEGSDLD